MHRRPPGNLPYRLPRLQPIPDHRLAGLAVHGADVDRAPAPAATNLADQPGAQLGVQACADQQGQAVGERVRTLQVGHARARWRRGA